LKVREAPTLMVGVTVVMAILIIVFGLYPAPIIRYAGSASRGLVDGIGRYIEAVLR